MADKITDEYNLVIGLTQYWEPTTPDARNYTKHTNFIKVPNPKNNLTPSQIRNAALTLITGSQPLILKMPPDFGDAAKFDPVRAVQTAYNERVRKIDFDIS